MQHPDEVLSGLYRAATGAMPWHAALQRLSDAADGSFCQLLAVDKASGRLALSLQSTSAPVEGALDYMREYHRHDPHTAYAMSLQPGVVLHTGSVVPAREAESHPFYRDFWAVYDTRYMSGGKVEETDEWVAFFGMARTARQGPFPSSAEPMFQRFLHHLREAFAIHRRYSQLSAQAESGRLVMEQTQRPICLLGPDRFVVHCNEAAQGLLRRADVLVQRGGYIGCRDPRAEDALTRALYALELEGVAVGASNPATRERRAFALRDVYGNAVPACLWALRPGQTMGAFGDTPRALLVLPTVADAVQPDPLVLAAGFDLTPAEGRLLASLATTMDIQEAARRLGISVHTARTHLNHIFDKTGVRTQKELLQQVHSLLSVT
jgi:DNA-binding CsgD family transcriptional regulator